MTTIQAILLLFCLIAAIFASVLFRSRLGYRLLILFFFGTATLFVLFPNLTNRIAHYLGVTRGADLLLYLMVFGVLHGFLLLYLRTRKLERRVTALIRSAAVRDAEHLESSPR